MNNTKKKVLKDIAFYILERTKYNFHENRFQWYHYILDIIDKKFLKPVAEEKKKTVPKNVISIRFVNKGLDRIQTFLSVTAKVHNFAILITSTQSPEIWVSLLLCP